MKPKLVNILIVTIVGFLIFSVTLGLLLSYVNFNPMHYEIKTDNTDCNLKNWNTLGLKNERDFRRNENSLLNGQTFQKLKYAQQQRANNLVIRNLTKFDVRFLKNCENVLSRNASFTSTLQFNKNQTEDPTFKSFADLEKQLKNKELHKIKSIKVDVEWEDLFKGLQQQDKKNLQEELLKFYNVIDHLYRKKDDAPNIDVLQFLFTIIRANNIGNSVIAVTIANTDEMWQYIVLSDQFSSYTEIQIGFESGFWSTDNIATVIVHEYGHALENILNSPLDTRVLFNMNKYPCQDQLLTTATIKWKYYQAACGTKKNSLFLPKKQSFVMDNRIKSASDWLVEWLAEQIGITEIMQKRLFAWSVVCSNYARTSSFRELFAEAFAQWLLTKPSERTVRWELLNKFFSEQLPHFNPI